MKHEPEYPVREQPLCERCPTPLKPSQGRFCSPICYRGPARVFDRVCDRCETVLTKRQHWTRQRHCSLACRLETARADPRRLAKRWTCAQCGRRFASNHLTARFCSRACAGQVGNALRQASTRETALLTLLWQHAGQPVEIATIERLTYGCDGDAERRAVWVTVRRLRRQIQHHRIETVRRRNRLSAYRLVRVSA